MKKYLFFAASALALASCSSDDFVGDNSGNLHGTTNGEIAFAGGTAKITRANDHVGADAAKLLGKEFIVAGFKSDATAPTAGISKNKVFDHYTVKWEANSAGTTADNTADWGYVGGTPYAGLTGLTEETKQTIKYWDYSAAQYDYVAFSKGNTVAITTDTPSDNQVLLSKVTPESATTIPTKEATGKVTGGAYTITGTAKALSGCYIADLVTAYKSADYSKEVNLTFRNLTTKARVAFYETVPGYSVKNIKFHQAEATTGTSITPATETKATLYTSGTEEKDYFFTKGTAGVYFPTVGSTKKTEKDYNKAHIVFFPESKETTLSFGGVNYDAAGTPITGTLKKTSKDPSFAGNNGGDTPNYYQTVIPNEDGTTLTLCVDYTLVADDGSNEEIHVYGAKAIIPAIYAQWKSNYAYTYIFKISDNTNGWTSTDKDQAGLFPITFNAVVVDAEENEQSTITTVATPSITTYQKGHLYSKADEYSAEKGDIYVRVMDGATIKEVLDTKAKLYEVTTTATNIPVSEATVHDALTIGASTTGAITKGRNGIDLKEIRMEKPTIIPGVDGNNITVDANTVAMFKPAAKTYAFVYEITPDPAPAQTELHTAVTFAAGTDLTGKGYYMDEACKNSATGPADGNTVYYQKITNTNRTYAIKVIKVVE